MDVIRSVGDQDFGLSDPSAAVLASQQAPAFLQSTSSSSWPPFLTGPESSAQWATYEYLFLVCLRTGDDKAADLCLHRLTERFGPANERIMALKGLYQEATAKDSSALQSILRNYDSILQENPVNVPILKRRAGLLRSLGRSDEAISALVDYVEAFPTDAEAWCELSDCYQANGMSAQAVFSLEEALLVVPNSWNLHARLGELLYISTSSTSSTSTEASAVPVLARSMRHFLRSLELCDSYARALYGLILVTSKLVKHTGFLSDNAPGDTQVPSKQVVEDVNSMAVQKAEQLVASQQSHSAPHGAQGDLLALKELVGQK